MNEWMNVEVSFFYELSKIFYEEPTISVNIFIKNFFKSQILNMPLT